MGFDPAGTDATIKGNLWGGWPTQPVQGSCDTLLDLLHDHDTAACDLFAQHQAQLTPILGERASLISQAIQSYDFAAAREMLNASLAGFTGNTRPD